MVEIWELPSHRDPFVLCKPKEDRVEPDEPTSLSVHRSDPSCSYLNRVRGRELGLELELWERGLLAFLLQRK